MSQLVDHQIVREMHQFEHDGPLIDPWNLNRVQPASYDLALGEEIRNELGVEFKITEEKPAEMWPGQFLLAHTVEYIRMPAHLCGRVEGKSSIGRQGLAVHVTAGFIDPGFHGQITLELKYQATLKHMVLRPGMLIAQITFHSLSHTPQRLYGSPGMGSHYQGQLGATPPAK